MLQFDSLIVVKSIINGDKYTNAKSIKNIAKDIATKKWNGESSPFAKKLTEILLDVSDNLLWIRAKIKITELRKINIYPLNSMTTSYGVSA